MRIGIVCPYNIFLHGGVQSHVKAQFKILKERGHQVFLITPRPYGNKDEAPDGVLYLGTSARVKAPHATSSDVSVSLNQDALEAIQNLNLELIHVHEPIVPFMARQILSSLNIPKIATFHAALPGNVLGKSLMSSYKAYARSVLPYIDEITAVSPAAIGYIEEDNNLPVSYIPNGIDLDDYRKSKKIKRSQNTILFIGRLEKRKGVKYLIKAFEIIKRNNPNLILEIAGDGPMRSNLENYVDSLGIKDIYFLGQISEEEKKLLLQKATVFTSPALYGESFGIVLVEAMALDAPIVANSNPGYAWVLKETGRISLCDVEDIDAYVRTLELFLENKELVALWQKWADQYVKQFSYEHVVDQYEILYKNHVR